MAKEEDGGRGAAGKPRALVVEDDPQALAAISEWIAAGGFTVDSAGSIEAARACIAAAPPDLAVLDLQLPDGSGLDLAREFTDRPDTDVVMVTGHGSLDTAVEALRGGAIDYLTKPVDLARLKRILAKCRKAWGLRGEITRLRSRLRGLGHFGDMVGASSAMQQIYDLVALVAPTPRTVLITGETGAGKDLVARLIHELSPRSAETFLPLNCGAMPANLVESELFGHEKGSFTGADRVHRGVFERAHGGTLFLDEIAEMSPDLQVRLLRVLEAGVVTRIGAEEPRPVDVRVVAATNRDPLQAVRDGRLREDLHYRLAVFPIPVPPLRDRSDDIPLLAEHFLAELNRQAAPARPKRLTEAALLRLREYTWPGNIRELKNVVERAYILAGDAITVRDIPLDNGIPAPQGENLGLSVGSSLAEVERRLILATLDQVGGNKKRASEILGISLKTLYTRLRAYKD